MSKNVVVDFCECSMRLKNSNVSLIAKMHNGRNCGRLSLILSHKKNIHTNKLANTKQ